LLTDDDDDDNDDDDTLAVFAQWMCAIAPFGYRRNDASLKPRLHTPHILPYTRHAHQVTTDETDIVMH